MDADPRLDDPYLRLITAELEDPQLFARSPAAVRASQQRLLVPFLDYFLRRDPGGYYRGLFGRKGLLGQTGELRPDVVLEDLAALRIHSDDLRGDGQRKRLVTDASIDGRAFRSSGTTGNTAGPVTVRRSPLQQHLIHRTIGGHLAWMVGQPLAGASVLIQAAPEMKHSLALPALAEGAFRAVGADVVFGARLRDDPNEPIMWRRLEHDVPAIERFLAAPAPRIWFATPPGLASVIDDATLLAKLGGRIDLGEGGVLLEGGGMKQRLRFATVRELLDAAAPVFRAHRGDTELAAPVVDALGLTESSSVFGNRAGDPRDAATWVKTPHPLAWVGFLESPRRLAVVPDPVPGTPHLMVYANFTCIDYLEVVVSGDLIARAPEGGFVYIRRAEEAEGFAIREGCG